MPVYISLIRRTGVGICQLHQETEHTCGVHIVNLFHVICRWAQFGRRGIITQGKQRFKLYTPRAVLHTAAYVLVVEFLLHFDGTFHRA